MLSDTPTVHQRTPLAVGGFDQNAGDRLRAAVEDTHLEVGELEIVDLVLVLAEILAQREVERVDRAVGLRRPTSSSRRRCAIFTTASETIFTRAVGSRSGARP